MLRAKNIRVVHAVLIALTIPLGFASRISSLSMPGIVRTYGGDVLSAVCIFFGVQFVLFKWKPMRCAILAYALCVLIELQQLIHWDSLVRLRNETSMGILLGHGFLWSDLVCYAVGTAVGVCISAAIISPER
jgi:Protein of unknown function (DUF2809)